MGICFSKKKDPPPSLPSPPPPPPPNSTHNAPSTEKKAEIKTTTRESAAAVAEAATVKKPVFIITQNKKPPAEEKDKIEHSPKKKIELSPKKERVVAAGEEAAATATAPAPVRTSSCTKEEVDAILIQCGRLSRSSSGKVSNDTAAHRRYSGSKRSYDFDNDKARDDGEDSEKATSRPSPRRRASSRERSGSRERGSGRRVSRSPGRRSDGPASANSNGGDRSKQQQQQPGKMVSVPAREKSVEATKRGSSSPAVTTKRGSSPRARSPANPSRISNENASQPQSLSRSSSRKAEQSPFRRNPMAEIDDNTVRSNQNKQQRSGNSQPQKSSENGSQTLKPDRRCSRTAAEEGIKANAISNCVRDQLMNIRAKELQPDPEITAKTSSKATEIHYQLTNGGNEILNPRRSITRTRSSRRSSRDFDLNPEALLINPSSYTTLLLEDINNYHQQSNNNISIANANADFPLPSCVSKACSILEAVADLNSDNKSYQGEGSSTDNGRRFGRRGLAPFVESEIVAKEDLMEPSLHKYITVRNVRGEEAEPQESAGSNSFIGQPWASPWEPNSADSSDRCWTSRSNRSEEVEEEQQALPEASCRPLRGGGSACVGNGRAGGRRDISLAASPAATF